MPTKSNKVRTEGGERLIHVRLKSDLHRRLRVQVAEEDTTIQEWVAALIEREIQQLETGKSGGKR